MSSRTSPPRWAPPARIISVWIIGVSTFQHGTARAELADIALHNPARAIVVL